MSSKFSGNGRKLFKVDSGQTKRQYIAGAGLKKQSRADLYHYVPFLCH